MSKVPAPSTMAELRDYVTGGVTTVPEGYGKFDITHNLLKSQFKEIQLYMYDTIYNIKDRLCRIAGTRIEYMKLYLNGSVLLDNDNATLISYNAKPIGDYIHIVDSDTFSTAANGAYEDVSQVEKYVMSEDEYNKRGNSVRAWKQQQKALREQQERDGTVPVTVSRTGLQANDTEFGLEHEEQIRQRIHIGDRCSVSPGDRRGVVRYIGTVPQLHIPEFIWIGIELDEPVGKHDGSVGGHKYFNARDKCGTFVKAFAVKTGDYPERDPFDSDNEDDNETKQNELMDEL